MFNLTRSRGFHGISHCHGSIVVERLREQQQIFRIGRLTICGTVLRNRKRSLERHIGNLVTRFCRRSPFRSSVRSSIDQFFVKTTLVDDIRKFYLFNLEVDISRTVVYICTNNEDNRRKRMMKHDERLCPHLRRCSLPHRHNCCSTPYGCRHGRCT